MPPKIPPGGKAAAAAKQVARGPVARLVARPSQRDRAASAAGASPRASVRTAPIVRPPGGKLAKPAAKPKPARGCPELRDVMGLTDLRRWGSGISRRVCEANKEVAFGTAAEPQLRMRPVAVCGDEPDGIPEIWHVSMNDLKGKLMQYRPVVLIGEKLLVTAGRAKVMIDRHPDCPADVLNAARSHIMRQAVPRLARSTNREVRKLSRMVAEQQEAIEDKLDQVGGALKAVNGLLARFRGSRNLTDEQHDQLAAVQKQIDFLMRRAGTEARLAEIRRPTEKDLDRTVLD